MTLAIIRRDLDGWGITYGPPGDGPLPAVLVLHGSEGGWSGWSHLHAASFAMQGFLAFPLKYSKGGNPWNAGSIHEVALDRTVEALDALRSAPQSSGKIGLYGMSRGAEHALLLTSLMARDGSPNLPDAVAVHSPPDVICGAFDAKRWRDPGDPGWQVWDPADRAWTWQGRSEALKPTTPIEIEHYPGPLFLSHGTEDRTWSVEMTRRLEKRLRDAGRSVEAHYYDGQGHQLDSDAQNVQTERLVAFFDRHLR